MKGSASDGGVHSEKRLGDAKGEEEVQERCRAILETIKPGRVERSRGYYYVRLSDGGAAQWVYLALWDDDSIGVRIYPGNTVRQARTFFDIVRKQEFFGLQGKGWGARPYLVALHIGTEVWWANGNRLRLEQYFDYWASEEIRQIRREDNGFEDLAERFRAHRLIDAKDQRNLHKVSIETKRDFLNVCPGFEFDLCMAASGRQPARSRSAICRSGAWSSKRCT